MHNKTLCLTLCFLIVFSATIAAAHAVSSPAILFPGDPSLFDRTITSTETATFEITIENNAASRDISLSLSAPKGWETSLSDNKVSLRIGDDTTVILSAKPPKGVEEGTYKLTLIASYTNGEAQKELQVSIGELDTPIELNSITFPDKMYPGKTVPFTLVLQNKKYKDEDNVKIIVNSGAFEEPFSVIKSFDGKEVKTISGEAKVLPFLNAAEYAVYIHAENGKKYTIAEEKSAIPAEGSLVEQEDVSFSFLSSTHTITITNKANYPLKDTYRLKRGGLTRIFTFLSPESSRIIDTEEGKYYEFDVDLESGKNMQIQYTVTYLPLILGIALLTVLIIWLYSRKKCTIKKRVLSIKKGEVKISLIVKNKSFRPLANLQITDRVPKALRPIHSASAMKPDVIHKHDAYSNLIWKIPKLGPKEERVFSYYVRASVQIVGHVSLPPAELEFRVRKRRESCLSNGALIRSK